MASTYDVGTKAWQPDAAEGWVASELISKDTSGPKVKLVFQLENGEVCCPLGLSMNPDVFQQASRTSAMLTARADQNCRSHGRCSPSWHRSYTSTANEPFDAGSKR